MSENIGVRIVEEKGRPCASCREHSEIEMRLTGNLQRVPLCRRCAYGASVLLMEVSRREVKP